MLNFLPFEPLQISQIWRPTNVFALLFGFFDWQFSDLDNFVFCFVAELVLLILGENLVYSGNEKALILDNMYNISLFAQLWSSLLQSLLVVVGASAGGW